METVCPNGSSQERELFSALSLKQLQRAEPLGTQGLQLVRKKDLIHSFIFFHKKLNDSKLKGSSAHRPVSPFSLCYSKILL